MNWAAERAAFENRVSSNFTVVPVQYPGVPFSPPAAGGWVKMRLLPSDSKRITLGPNAIFREHGILLFMILTPANEGTHSGRVIADQLSPIFHEAIFSLNNSGMIRCQVPILEDRGLTSDGNWYQHNLSFRYHRDVGSLGFADQIMTSNFTAIAGYDYLLDSSAGSFTVTVPSGLVSGDEFTLEDHTGYSEINPVTVSRNGYTIDGLAENFVINSAYVAITFRYNGTTLIPRLRE